MSTLRIPRCSFGAGKPTQCRGVARWITMNTPGNPTRMIWCDKCHAELTEHEFRTGRSKHQRLTTKLKATLDQPWQWFPEEKSA